MVYVSDKERQMWVWRQGWQELKGALALVAEGRSDRAGRDGGLRLYDVDADGICELIDGGSEGGSVYHWNPSRNRWEPARYRLPAGVRIVDALGRDAGFRFVDLDGDHRADILYSDPFRCAVYLFATRQAGWQRVRSEARSEPMGEALLPPFVRLDGSHNGVWFRDGYLWVQNEQTGGKLENHVRRVKLRALLEPAMR